VNPARVQDFIFGADRPTLISMDELAHEALINAPLALVSSSLRALFFAAQAILCEDADLILIGGVQGGQSAAMLLASPVSVGIYNLTPLARIDARSLTSAERVLKKAQLASEDVNIQLDGTCGVLLAVQLIQQLHKQKAAWGLANIGTAAILMERI
jgi:acetyl-CoA acetyltransferase